MVSGEYSTWSKGNEIKQHASGVKWKIQDLALAEHRIQKLQRKIARLSDITGKNYSMPQFGTIEHKTNVKNHIVGLESQVKRYNARFKVANETVYNNDGTIVSVKGYSQASLAIATYKTKVHAIIDSLPKKKVAKAMKDLGITHTRKNLTLKDIREILDKINVGLSYSNSGDAEDENQDEDNQKLTFSEWQYKFVNTDDIRKINSGIATNNDSSINDFINLAKEYEKYSNNYDKHKDTQSNDYENEVIERVKNKLKSGKYE